jgi:hypothetical protein
MKGVLKFMKNYLFEIMNGEYEGEMFFVQANNREEADEILGKYFWGETVKCRGIYTDEEAERMGYDTY